MSLLVACPASFANNTEAGTTTFAIPDLAPANAVKFDPAPIGISYEFFTFPSYHINVTAAPQCEKNLREATGTWPPIRIGGTTQDRATFDSSLSAYVTYSVASSKDAPNSLNFGPSFLALAGQYEGNVVLGLNRGHNDVSNTVAAAKSAKAQMPNLLAIELGNEPDFFKSDKQPIASGTWNAANDASSEANWQIHVGKEVGSIIQASNAFGSPPTWGAEQLTSRQNASALSYVKTFSHHNYPGGSIQSLMSHTNVAKNVNNFKADIEAAKKAGKEYVLGETNSATSGGAANVSPSFGAALWVADISLRAVSSGISRLYFHHGTIGACQYCWFGRSSIGSPYYGSIFAASAFGDGSSILPLDTGNSAYAAYAIFDNLGKPVRVALYNSDYFTSCPRSLHVFTLTGLSNGSVSAKRLTANSATARADQGDRPTWGGQTYEDGTCKPKGTELKETVAVSDGQASFTVGASEALLVYL